MFERYTEKARRVIFFSRYEAGQYGATAIEVEHILLGLLREDRSLVRELLGAPQLIVGSIRKEIEARTTVHDKVSGLVDLPLSVGAERVLTFAAEESDGFGHRHIGTEHLLLGILREDRSTAAQILYNRGLRLEKIRAHLTQAASAGLTTTLAKGTFEVALTPQPSEAPTLGCMMIDKVLKGDLEGSSKGLMLTAGTDVEGSAGYVALERVTATLHGRKGTFALQHSGTMNRGEPDLTIAVVPDSGTGELIGLSGTLAVTIAEAEHSYDFEYRLDDHA